MKSAQSLDNVERLQQQLAELKASHAELLHWLEDCRTSVVLRFGERSVPIIKLDAAIERAKSLA